MGRNKSPAKRRKTEIDYLKQVADGVDDMTTVSTMTEERIVPTMFTGYNRAAGIGGHPLGCLTIVHGPEQVGKTVLALAIAESLRRAGHPSLVFDTEFAGEKEWYSTITPASGYKRTGDLDEFIGDVQKTISNLQDGKRAKKAERIPEDVGCVFVCDTLTKLMPRDILDKIESEGVDKQYPLQAQWVALWLRSVIPQLYRSNSSMIVVLQERANVGARPNQKQYKVTLGRAVQYDNRLRLRVNYSKKVKMGERIVGMECHYTVENNKIVGTTHEEAVFFTSNGRGDVPKGLDLVREVVEEAKKHGVLKKKKDAVEAWFGGRRWKKVGGGWADLRERLLGDGDLLAEFVERLNARTVKGICTKKDGDETV